MTSPSPPDAVETASHDGRFNQIVEGALLEDLGMGDVTTEATVPADALGQADLLVKEEGTVAGLEVAALVARTVDPHTLFVPHVADGAAVKAGTVAATLEGHLAAILRAERTLLNVLQRMSGIATLTRMFVRTVDGTGAKITDTRKTAPGLRVLDKLAVRLGGGVNHRFGLDDMVLIKDNHIAAAGSVAEALQRCAASLKSRGLRLRVEVETRSLRDVEVALKQGGFDRIMLDHFSLDDLRKAVSVINHAVEIEASGNISLRNVRAVAETGVDFISVGALTHSPHALDMSLKIAPVSPARHP